MRVLLLLVPLLLVLPGHADERKKPTVERAAIKVGETSALVVTTRVPGSSLVFCNMHEDEKTSVAATKKSIAADGGTLVELKHAGTRRVSFKFGGKPFDFDPNRVFSPKGVRATLAPAGKETEEAAKQVDAFGKALLDGFRVGKTDLVVAVHNNTDGGYSILSYLPRGSEELAAAEVHVSKKRDADDFFYVTHAGLFKELKARDYNVVLQNDARVPDDGSLSVHCGKRSIPYVNIEAKHGHLDEQADMIRALREVVAKVKPRPERKK